MKRLSLALLFLLSVPVTLHAQLYGVSLNGFDRDNTGPSSLYQVDEVTGAGTLVGVMNYPVNSIAVDPTTGLLYAASSWWEEQGMLLMVEPATGAAFPIGAFGEGRCVVNIMFDASGQMYGREECSEITIDGLVTIDKSTGMATDVGDSGFQSNTRSSVMAFDSAGTLHFVEGDNNDYYLFNTGTGTATYQKTLRFMPGSGGSVFDGSDQLWAPAGFRSGKIQDSQIRISDLAAETFVDIDTDVEYLNALAVGDFGVEDGTAQFRVLKSFSDGGDGNVDVTLTCNGGTPLQQTFSLEGGDPDGVTFTVLSLPDSPVMCTVTESSGPDGYTAELNGGMDCEWSDVSGKYHVCYIVNYPSTFDFVVDFEWDDTAADATGSVGVDLYCTNVKNPDGTLDTSTRSEGTFDADATSDTEFKWLDVGAINDDEDSDGVPIDPTTCWAEVDYIDDMTVEVMGCDPFVVSPGEDEANCTLTASVFFEGIPTLSQYGMALMALLMLGIGFIGLRRFA